jgi:hypothetical protein
VLKKIIYPSFIRGNEFFLSIQQNKNKSILLEISTKQKNISNYKQNTLYGLFYIGKYTFCFPFAKTLLLKKQAILKAF